MTISLFDQINPEWSELPALSDGQHSVSYRTLQSSCKTLASVLVERQARSVALQLDNSIDWIIADLACQLADIPLLPIPVFFTSAQTRHALEQSNIDTFLTSTPSLLADATDWHCHTHCPLDSVSYLQRACTSKENRLPLDTGKITYTSGSTGAPKGVCLSNRQLVRQASALQALTGLAGSRHLCLLPLAVLLENVAGVYSCLLGGGTVLVPPPVETGLSGSSGLSAKTMLTAISRYQPNTLILLPQLLMVMVSACEQGWNPPSSLRFIAVGGSKVAPSLLARARHLQLPVYEGYGLSECASVVSLNTPENNLDGSAGMPLPHLDLSIEDGEIHVTGNAFLGYVGDTNSCGQTTIFTGDLGQLDSRGFLHIEGRKKNLLISSFGRNISPEWVESELLANGLLEDCVVFGDAKPFLCALVYPRTGRDASPEEITKWFEYCNRQLPDYAQVKRWMQIPHPLTHYPGLLTATGKPRRPQIERQFHQELSCLYSESQEVFSNDFLSTTG